MGIFKNVFTPESCLTMFDFDRYQRYRWYRQHVLGRQPGGDYWDSYFPQFYQNNQCLDGCPVNSHCQWGFCECDEGFYKSWGLCSTASTHSQFKFQGSQENTLQNESLSHPQTTGNVSHKFLFRAASRLGVNGSVRSMKPTLPRTQGRAKNVGAQANVPLTTSI